MVKPQRWGLFAKALSGCHCRLEPQRSGQNVEDRRDVKDIEVDEGLRWFQVSLVWHYGKAFFCELVAIVVPSLAETVKSGHRVTKWTWVYLRPTYCTMPPLFHESTCCSKLRSNLRCRGFRSFLPLLCEVAKMSDVSCPGLFGPTPEESMFPQFLECQAHWPWEARNNYFQSSNTWGCSCQ